MIKKYSKGFTLIEILIAVAIVGIIAAVAFVALNPGKRLEDSRNARRWSDLSAMASAIKVKQVDDGGAYMVTFTGLTAGTPYMIGTCGGACTTASPADCEVAIGLANGYDLDSDTGGVNAITTYIAANPTAPSGNDSGITWDGARTGYYIVRNSSGTITVGSCESEPTGTGPLIQVQR
ncbi:MAG: prepilin-type N-terminal cleavage/methylation domain-containing protein [Patescibacteria group bacterium]